MQDRALAAGIVSLTLQDMVWVNLLVTGTVQEFDFDKLEKATFRQFNRGTSVDVPAQAAGLLSDFATAGPFSAGNFATGLIACAAFLSLNGFRLAVSPADAPDWMRRVAAGQVGAADRIEAEPHSRPSPWFGVESAVKTQYRRYRGVLGEMAEPLPASR